MSKLWKPRPPSFPSDDSIPYTAAQVNEFDDIQDLNFSVDNERKPSEDEIELESIQKAGLFRAQDSIFVRQKQRNSVVGANFPVSDEDSDSQSARNVKFESINSSQNNGQDNQGFDAQEEEVVLRRKTASSDNSFNANDPFDDDEVKAWDIFKTLPPPDEDETLDGVWVEFFIKCLKIFVYILTFVVILSSAVVSKSLILLMASMTRVNRDISICNEFPPIFQMKPELELDKRYKAIYREDDPARLAWIWCLFFAVIAPDVFALGRSLRICFFKKYQVPKWETFITVISFETLNSMGLSLLVFIILPTIDSIKGSMITNSVCLIPGILLLLKQKKSTKKNPKQSQTNDRLTIGAIVCQIISLIVWPIIAYYDDDHNNYVWCLPIALLLISMCWWENFLNRSSKNVVVQRLMTAKKDLAESRYFTYIFISIWKMIVVFVVIILKIHLNDGSAALKTFFKDFVDIFNTKTIQIIRDKEHLEMTALIEGESHVMTIDDPLIPVWIFLIQMTSTYFCYAFAKFSCKIHIQTISFAIPVHLVVPMTVSAIWVMIELSVEHQCQLSHFFHGFQYIFWFTKEKNTFDYYNDWKNYTTTIIWVLSLVSQIIITLHIWTATSARLASTEELFVNPMYNSVLIDQSLAMNRRRFNLREEQMQAMEADEENAQNKDKDINDNLYESVDTHFPETVQNNEEDDTVRIFVCATMWHENTEEMIQMLKAVMRLDEDQFNKKMARQFFAITDYYDIEFNIFFDDAYDQGDPNVEDDRKINRFVKQLIETMDDAASNVHGTNVHLKKPNVVPTPYGGKLEWTLPGQNKLVAHLKDKLLIRHRKRWSQCMYMYYLLGHRIAELPIDDNRKETIAMNTFILALDGDINFRPQALHLVVDLMKKNRKLGAACGRIHPIGSGPMVWYQKFEYAIGHWLQKATEHVFGCVLCSPGCFSLFRARAVMDDSVMNKYTTKPTEALHYVQYDQGEDRWLCTLLLQQGWRIEYCAASDSYTHAPEGFGEFYTQRRRWAPSTMANILDLLANYKNTCDRNTDISKPYILYQAMLMLGTVLSPGTIFLMTVGAMNTVLGLESSYSLGINIFPILIFSIVCLVVKKNDYIIYLAMVLSTIYALLMLAVLVGTAIDISDQGPWTPNSIFFMGMMASFVLAAILHPQEFACVLPLPLYMLLIPSMYLLLTIYSVTNMHVVSWGTREVKATLTAKEIAAQAEAARLAAEAKKNKKGLFGFLDMSNYRSKSGIFTCMCCSNSKPEEDSAHLLEIKEKINRVYDNIDNIKSNFDPKPNRSSLYRRKSFGSREQNSVHLSVTQEEDEEEEDMESISETTSLIQDYRKPSISFDETIQDMSRPKWARDSTFIGFPYVELTENEHQFWKEFVPKYLLPLDENPTEQKRIANDLKELRNRAVFAFGIINVVFILFVFLLQMHKDIFGIRIVSGSYTHKNYSEKEDTYVDVVEPRHTTMDPIGLVLVVFFGTILIIQLIGMFMHRFGTLAHLLAFTPIDFFEGRSTNINKMGEQFSENLNKTAVRITRQLQKQGVNEMTEADVKKTTDPLNRRQSVFQRPQTSQPLDLHKAFFKRMNSIKPDDHNIPKFQGISRKSIGQAIVDRRKTIDWGRLPSGDILERFNSQQDSSRNASISSFNPSVNRPKSITFQMDAPTLQPPPKLSHSNLRSNLNQSPVIKRPDTPKVIVTPTSPNTTNKGPPTGQHSVAYINFRQQNMANDLSRNIIRNSLNELRPKPEQNKTQNSNDYQIASTSTSPEPRGQTPQPPQLPHQLQPNRNNSNESESNSSVSSNIDFNFDAFEDSDTSGEFPVSILHPTVVKINNTPNEGVNPSFSDLTNRKHSTADSDEMSTQL